MEQVQYKFIQKPYPPQEKFFKSKTRFTLYGGARAGGKSWAVRTKAILLAINITGIQILLLRRTFPELQENHVLELEKQLKGIATHRVSDKVFVFPNGSRIKLGYCKLETDVLQYQGQAYDVIFLDEATHFTEFQYHALVESNRLSGNIPLEYKFKPRMYLSANPGGVGHMWVKRLFIDRNFRGRENPDDYSFIPARIYDNKYFMENDPDYVNQLENLPEKRRMAMLEGNWDVFEGQMFEEFDPAIHVINRYIPQPNDRIYRVRDYGLDMLACYWIALSPDNTAVVYKELYESNLIVSDAGNKINSMTTETIYSDLAPPDLWNRNSGTGKSAVDIFRDECGQFLTRANNDRVNGWLSVKEWLAIDGKIKDKNGNLIPKLRIASNCRNLIRTLPLLQHDDKNPNDVSKDPHEITHGPDALRYFCSSWTYPPQTQKDYSKSKEREWALRKTKRNPYEGSYMIW